MVASQRYKCRWGQGDGESWEWKLSMKTPQEKQLLCMLIKERKPKERNLVPTLWPPFFFPLTATSAIMSLFKQHLGILGDKNHCVIVWSCKWLKLVRILIASKWLYYLLVIESCNLPPEGEQDPTQGSPSGQGLLGSPWNNLIWQRWLHWDLYGVPTSFHHHISLLGPWQAPASLLVLISPMQNPGAQSVLFLLVV